MGTQISTDSITINMKTFAAISALLAVTAADQASHQSIVGHGAVVSHGVQKAHGANHALVHVAPVVGAALVHGAHAPVHHAVQPVVHHAPAFHHAPVAVHHAPIVHHTPVVHHAPVVHRPVVHAAPAFAPAPIHGHPGPDAPPVYAFEYGVADEYSGANFGQNEARDGYSTNGQYRVALPDGRTQIVTYNVADAYSGYVADVKYEGVAQYAPAPVKVAHPAPVYHA